MYVDEKVEVKNNVVVKRLDVEDENVSEWSAETN